MEVDTEKGKKVEPAFSYYITHTTRALMYFRMWKADGDFPIWKTACVLLNMTVLLSCNFLLALSEFWQLLKAQTLINFAMGYGTFWLHILGFTKWFYLVCKVPEIIHLVGQLEECYDLSFRMSEWAESTSKLLEGMNTAKKHSVQFSYVWSLFVVAGVGHWCLNPVILELSIHRENKSSSYVDRDLAHEVWIPWDTDEKSGYWYAYMFGCMGSLGGIVGTVWYNNLYMTLLIFICAQFEYLNYFLESKGESDSIKNSSARNIKLRYSFLKKKLEHGRTHHTALLKFLSGMEEVMTSVMLFECLGSTAAMCFVLYGLSTMNLRENRMEIGSTCEYLLGCSSELFLFCYYAGKVTDAGLEVSNAVYNCGWELLETENEGSTNYRREEKERKSVAFIINEIIARSQQPVLLTGGRFYILSVETFSSVISAAFSYTAVLRSTSEEQ